MATSARIASLDWTVIAHQPVAEAFASIRAGLWRSLALVIAVAPRRDRPRLLAGVPHVGADPATRRRGAQDRRRPLRPSDLHSDSGDELEQLADRFNEMAKELAVSQEKSERITLLKRFLAAAGGGTLRTCRRRSICCMVSGRRRRHFRRHARLHCVVLACRAGRRYAGAEGVLSGARRGDHPA